jgi:hypothetical protein
MKTPIIEIAWQHAVDTVNGIYLDKDQKHNDIVDILQIKHKSFEPKYSCIERFATQRVWAEDVTKKTFMDGLSPNIPVKIAGGSSPRTYQEAKRSAKEVAGRDGHILKV